MKKAIFTNRIATLSLFVTFAFTPLCTYSMLLRTNNLKFFSRRSVQNKPFMGQRRHTSYSNSLPNCSRSLDLKLFSSSIGAAITESHVLKNMLLIKSPNPSPMVDVVQSLFCQLDPTQSVVPVTNKLMIACALNTEIIELIANATKTNDLEKLSPYITNKWQSEYAKVTGEQAKDTATKIENLLSSINKAYVVDKYFLHSVLLGFLWKSAQHEQPNPEDLILFLENVLKIKNPYDRITYAKNNFTLAISTIIEENKKAALSSYSDQEITEHLLDSKILSHEYTDQIARALFYVHPNPCIDRPLLKAAYDSDWKSSIINSSVYYALSASNDYQKINIISDILFFNKDKEAIDYAYALFKSISQESRIILIPNIITSDPFMSTLRANLTFNQEFNNFIINNAEQAKEIIEDTGDEQARIIVSKLLEGMDTSALKNQFLKAYIA